MRKFLVIAIPIVALGLFICIMLSGSFLKKPFGQEEDIEQSIERIKVNINNEKWDDVTEKVEELEKNLKKVIKRVQFSSERDEINFINSSIARLKGAVSARDKSDALVEINDAYNHWKQLGE